jgi:hypothetical protein
MSLLFAAGYCILILPRWKFAPRDTLAGLALRSRWNYRGLFIAGLSQKPCLVFQTTLD